VLLAIIASMVWQARNWDARASLFPLAIGIPALVIAILQLGFAARTLRAPAASAPSPAPARSSVGASDSVIADGGEHVSGVDSLLVVEDDIPPSVVRRRTLEMVSWILAIAAGIVLLGFELGSATLSLVFLRVRAHESWRTSVIIAVTTYLFFYVIFDRAVGIPFPNGAIADAFGLNAFDHYLMDPLADLIQGK
jgi:hypothetical protein